MLEVGKAIEAPEAPAIKAVDAAVVDLAETVTFAAAGQEATDCEGPMYTPKAAKIDRYAVRVRARREGSFPP